MDFALLNIIINRTWLGFSFIEINHVALLGFDYDKSMRILYIDLAFYMIKIN